MIDDAAYAALCSAVTLQSNEKGFFGDVADDVTEMAGAEWLRHFAGLRSNRERIAECLSNERVKHLVGRMIENVRQVYRGKSATVSTQRRLEAEHLRRSGKTDKSLVMFTQSVVKAPSAEAEGNGGQVGDDNGRSLAMALWGRSEILYERKRTLRCLEDVKLSLREKLPEKFRLQAYLRMAECYASLDRLHEARIASDIVSRLAQGGDDDDSDLSEARARNRHIRSTLNERACACSATAPCRLPTSTNAVAVAVDDQNGIAAAAAAATAKTETETEMATTLADGEHARLKRVSSKLALAETPEAGRYYVAARPIRTGDTLVVEDAYVRCLSVERFGSHCHHCMLRLETAMPCSECSAVAFCSLACRSSALDSYHKYECRYTDLLIGSGMSILCFVALRIVSQQSVAYFENADLDVDDDDDDDAEADNDHPYRRIYNMVRHERRRSADDYFRRTLMAIFLASVLAKSGYLGGDADADAGTADDRNPTTDFGSREMLIAVVLLRNLEVLQFNAHEISETVWTGNAAKTRSIGVGLYASASFFNHQCFPAVTRFFRGSTLIVRAVRPLPEGQTVGDCYGPVWDKFDTSERRRRLRARYWFECECEACSRDWPKSGQLASLPRDRCGRSAAAIDDAAGSIEDGRCGHDADANANAASSQLDRLRQRLQKAEREPTPQAVAEICEAVDSLDERHPPPHELYRRAADALTRYWSRSQS